MRIKQVVLGPLATLIFAIAALGADQYQIDPVHTLVGFSVRHMLINNVTGRFTDFSGTIVYDENDINKSSVSVTIKTASINTGVEKRDNDLRSANFLEADKNPTITFQSTRIEKRGEGIVAVGLLTMHGVSKEIALPFTINGKIKDPGGRERIGVEPSLTVDRRDWGITYSKALDNGGLIVGNEIRIQLNVEGVKS